MMLESTVKPSDALLLDPNLLPEDQIAMQGFASANLKKSKAGLFDPVSDQDQVKKLDFAVKAILQHIIDTRKLENGDTTGA